MKIESGGRVSGPGSLKKKEKAEKSSSAFADLLAEKTSSSASVAGPSALSGVSSVLALQEVDNEGEERRRAFERGEALLDHLEELRRGIIMGNLSPDSLLALSRMVKSRRAQIRDPRMIEILDEIELRAAVELAKFGIF